MNPLKVAIFSEVRKKNEEAAVQSDDQLNRTMFHHDDGLRLSLNGFILTKAIFTAYSFEIPNTIKTRHRKNFSLFEFPYFFTNKRLVLFGSGDAVMIKLHGGIESFLEDR